MTGSQQVPLLPSSENDAWEINNKSIPVTQQLQGSNHWETLGLYLVCLYLNGLLLLLFSKLVPQLVWDLKALLSFGTQGQSRIEME